LATFLQDVEDTHNHVRKGQNHRQPFQSHSERPQTNLRRLLYQNRAENQIEWQGCSARCHETLSQYFSW